MPGGGEGLQHCRDGGRGCQRRTGGSQEDFRRGGCAEGGVPNTPRVKMKIYIVTRENKILTHDLIEKNPTIM